MVERKNYNVGIFNKTKQVTLYKHENDGLSGNLDKNKTEREYKMQKKNYTPSPKADSTPKGKFEIVDADAWVNLGGKALFVKIEGKSYITSRQSIEQLLSGEKKGVKLGLVKE